MEVDFHSIMVTCIGIMIHESHEIMILIINMGNTSKISIKMPTKCFGRFDKDNMITLK